MSMYKIVFFLFVLGFSCVCHAQRIHYSKGTTLWEFAAKGDAAGVRRALARGEDPNQTDIRTDNEMIQMGRNPLKVTALHVACMNGILDIVKMLVNAGAKLEPKGKGGLTPLQYAVRFDRKTVVRYLLSKGADPDTIDDRGYTPVRVARETGAKDIYEDLVDAEKRRKQKTHH